jgi:hypothetical protein
VFQHIRREKAMIFLNFFKFLQGDWQEIEQALMGADFSILDRQAR